MPFTDTDRRFMRQALALAEEAFARGEIPVGALVVGEGRIIAKAANQTEQLLDVTAHAELLAATAAAQALGSKYISGCTLYVTLEPCVMCAGTLFWARPARIVVAAPDPKRGFLRYGPTLLHPRTILEQGLMADEARALLREFFRLRREE